MPAAPVIRAVWCLFRGSDREWKSMRTRGWTATRIYLLPMLLGAALAGLGCKWSCPRDPPAAEGETGASAGPPLFRDVTQQSGVSATYRNGEEANLYTLLETLGGGVALLDYDGDGLLDIFVTGGGYFREPAIHGHPSKLFKNLGHWQFQDVTHDVGLDQPLFYTHACAVADYDRDGWPDLLVTGWGRVALYHNEPDGKGGRRFVDRTGAAGLTVDSWSTSAAWGDLDGDGYPDLYLCHYCDWHLATNHPTNCNYDGKTRDVCSPARFTALPHQLFRNNGDGTFTDVSKEAGLRVEHPTKDYGRGLGVLLVDVDGDGRPDVYVANDLSDNFLYLNRSTPGKLRFEEVGMTAGVARDDRGQPNGSMGLAAGDYDGCGRPSLWVTNYAKEDHALYHAEGTEPVHFRFATQASGIGAVGKIYVGWGTGFFDIDHHGWEDLFFATGHERRHPGAGAARGQRPVLLRNRGQGRFTDITARGGPYFQVEHLGRGVALGDLDNDGRIDLLISHVNEPVVLLRNEADSGNHWLGIELAGQDNADVVGARLSLEVAGRRLTRFAQGGGSYASSSDRRHVFGLGRAARAERLTVTWPSGRVQSWDGLAADRYWRIIEGQDPM
jgi:enediyne biosynthesis protein E4